MPFLARCPFCQKEFRAAETMEGRSVTCKHCGDAFTLARAEALPAAVAGPAMSRTSSISHQGAPRPIGPSDPTPHPSSRAISAATDTVAVPSRSEATLREPAKPQKRSWGDNLPALGVLSLCLGGIALVCVSFPSLRFGTLALAAGGVALGFIGWLTADHAGRRKAWMPVAGAVLCIPVLVIAGFFPRLLAITLPDDVKTPSDDPAKLLAVPFGGTAVDPPSEWLDASRYSVQQGDLRVRILSVSIGHVELTSRQASRSPQPYLQIRVEVANARVRKRLDYQGWARADGVVLRDQAGRTFRLHAFGPGVEVSGQLRENVALGPFDKVTDVLVFEAPAAPSIKGIERLRLELPAASAGGIGTLKFEIPRGMIQRH